MKFLKPTKKKGLLTLLLIVFYYVAYFFGMQVSGLFTEKLVPVEELLEAIQPMMPQLMSQMGLILKMAVVLFAIQFIFILILSYIFACLIMYMVNKKSPQTIIAKKLAKNLRGFDILNRVFITYS